MRSLVRAIAVAVAVLSMLAVAQAAQADTGTGNQNPDLAVTAALVNAADGGDVAAAGDRVRAAASVENRSTRRQIIKITVALTPPGGETYKISYPFIIGAGRTASVSLTFPILRIVPPGEYTLGVSATGSGGTSSADASITIVE
jgi:uncharacterized protein YfaS (alpha-2-macroglobulin family)